MSLIDKFKKERLVSKKLVVLDDAIRTQNLTLTNALIDDIKNEAKFEFAQGSLLSTALQTDNADIFAAVHKTLADPNYYFTSSTGMSVRGYTSTSERRAHVLYEAIDAGKANVAAYLARHPGVAIDKPGEVVTLIGHSKLERTPLEQPLELAAKKRMGIVAGYLRGRINNPKKPQTPEV